MKKSKSSSCKNLEASDVGEMSVVLKLLLRKERPMHVPPSKEKEGKGSLTYDVQYIVTDLTTCTQSTMCIIIC